jgi:16S rRNA processing protein RimM
VGRPHGLDGSFHVTRPQPELLAAGRVVAVRGSERRIERLGGTAARPVVWLSGCVARADAEALRGADLLVAVVDAPALEEDEFWAHELAGCLVVDGSREVGVVRRMVALPSCEALDVDGLLIPLVRDAIRSIDVAARRIDVDMGFVGE